MNTDKLLNLQERISEVTNDILARFPNCSYTIRILLWDDDTELVECRHGNMDRVCISSYYDGKLVYEEIPLNRQNVGMLIDEYGNEYHMR